MTSIFEILNRAAMRNQPTKAEKLAPMTIEQKMAFFPEALKMAQSRMSLILQLTDRGMLSAERLDDQVKEVVLEVREYLGCTPLMDAEIHAVLDRFNKNLQKIFDPIVIMTKVTRAHMEHLFEEGGVIPDLDEVRAHSPSPLVGNLAVLACWMYDSASAQSFLKKH